MSEDGFCFVSEPRLLKLAHEPVTQNILFVTVDTLRSDFDQNTAPNMTNFGKGAVNFNNNIANGNMTSPSTNSLLTCQPPHAIPDIAFSYSVPNKVRNAFYKKNTPSFPQIFKDQGILQTAMIGNVSLVSETIGIGVNHGFSEQVSYEFEGYETAQAARAAILWLEQNHNRPFFLYVHLNAPHAAYRAPVKDLMTTYRGMPRSMSDFLLWQYRGEVHYADRMFGEILSALKKLGIDENTHVVLTGDHGDQMTPRSFKHNEAGPVYYGSFFDHGATLLNDEIKVPLMIRPAVTNKDLQWQPRTTNELTQLLDVAPTLLDFYKIPTPEYCKGASLKDLIEGKPLRVTTRSNTPSLLGRTVGVEGYRERAVIFDSRYKYIKSYNILEKKLHLPDKIRPIRASIFMDEQLFDLETDPKESQNLAHDNIPLVEQARKKFREQFNIKTHFELVFDAPTSTAFNVKINEQTLLLDPAGNYQPNLEYSSLNFNHTAEGRHIIRYQNKGQTLPTVTIDGDSIPMRSTRLRVPLNYLPSRLPLELAGPDELLPIHQHKPMVYIRHVEESPVSSRVISTGNPMFERLLREWGYLKDE
jgi:arylsulfatase A-like enzyme